MERIRIYNIDWDTGSNFWDEEIDGPKPVLTTEITVDTKDVFDSDTDFSDTDMVEELINCYLAWEYGWLVNGYNYTFMDKKVA